ncbi:LysR family transcriptional regulator [Pleomorphomonas sp. NRK KF1]|uniref:LysR family transcriptional regulator n=1 Tax=Pleomorphomonas sp. NRK KF1 TaxID=2943000 RepID=UPI002043D920|nr:LysR family transcriptional regulator [Pleomorphomonas sp. NRK KF1]MCM5552267.1 LysR family transcriptional regulator [Pleomorphomonas sp. NRK KF1]
MRTDLEMAALAAIVRHGSLSAAARHLGLSVSVISDRLTSLETRLGVRLIARTTRRQSLTEAGRLYLTEMEPILAAIDDLEIRVRDLSATPRGTLRVTAPMPIGRRWIAPFVGDFITRYPDIHLKLVLEDRYVDIVGEGFDVAIRGGPAVESEFTGRFLASTRRVTVASPDYLKVRGIPEQPDDLAAHDCLIFNAGGHFHADWRFGRGEASTIVRVSARLATSSSELPVTWAVAGLGLTQKSLWEVQEHIDEGRLVIVLDAFEPDPASFFAIHPVSRSQSRLLSLFIGELAAFLKPRFAS